MRRLAAFVAVTSFLTLSACKERNGEESDPNVARDATTNQTSPAPVMAFVTAAQQVQGAANHTGTIPSATFVNMIPLSNPDRQVMATAFPNPFQVQCNGARCSASTSGNGAVVTLLASVRINFLITITNPAMTASPTIRADFVLRGDAGVEFCNVNGLSVTSSGLTKTIYGLFDRVEGNQAHLTVGDEPQDYTCEL